MKKCETCKHWSEYIVSGTHRACEKVDTDTMYFLPNVYLRPNDGSVHLMTSSDFSCANHEMADIPALTR